MSAGKRPPAFGRAIAKQRRQGMRPASGTVWIRLDHWPPHGRPAHVRIPQVVVPSDADPAALEWGFLADLDAIVLLRRDLTPPNRVRAALRAILTGNPARLIVIEPAGGMWFVKSAAAGVEVSL